MLNYILSIEIDTFNDSEQQHDTVLDKTLKGIRDVRLNNRKVLLDRTKYTELFFYRSIDYILKLYLIK